METKLITSYLKKLVLRAGAKGCLVTREEVVLYSCIQIPLKNALHQWTSGWSAESRRKRKPSCQDKKRTFLLVTKSSPPSEGGSEKSKAAHLL